MFSNAVLRNDGIAMSIARRRCIVMRISQTAERTITFGVEQRLS